MKLCCFPSRALCLIVLSSMVVIAQGGGGSVSGTIVDTAGAVIPNASVELTNQATGVVLRTTSTSAGEYVFPVVPTSNYTLAITASGFKKGVANNLTVNLNQPTSVDVTLSAGGVESTVDVAASALVLQTDTSQQATTIQNRAYEELPLSVATGEARSPIAFLFLAPGVSAPKNLNNTGQSFNTRVNGGQNFQSEVQIDGASIHSTNVSGDLRNVPFAPDAVQEFTLISSNYSAEYGRTGGGIITFVTKSGTNQFHGGLYEYLRNDVFDARGFFATTPPVNRQNDFGGTIGGPIYLPRFGEGGPTLYNGRNRTFFFAYYNGFRYRTAQGNTLFTIPTPAMRQGDFSNFRDAQGTLIPIYDPLTTAAVTLPDGTRTFTRQQFPGNIIPQERITGTAQRFGSLLPPLAFNRQINNAFDASQTRNDNDRLGVRLDHNFSENSRIGFTLLHENVESRSGSSPYSGVLSAQGGATQEQYITRINHTYTFRPNLLNQFTMGYNRNRNPFFAAVNAVGLGQVLGIQGLPLDYSGVGFQGYAGTGGEAQNVVENSWVFNDFVSWIRGRDSFKFGVDFRRNGDNTLGSTTVNLGFATAETSLPLNSSTRATTGNSYASFLIGAVDNTFHQLYASSTGNRFQYLAGYAQDDLKVNQQLTLNLGLRYDLPWTRYEVADRMSTFDPNTPNPGAGGRLGALVFAGRYGNRDRRFTDLFRGAVQPRLGFAYQLNSKTVARGGYAIFYSSAGDVGENGIRINYSSGFNNIVGQSSPDGGITPLFYYQNGVPPVAQPPFIDPTLNLGSGVNWLAREDGRPSTIQNWNFGVQRSLPGGFAGEVFYVASKGNHLGSGLVNVNQVDSKYLALGDRLNARLDSPAGQSTGVPLPYPGFRGTVAQALRPFPQYQGISRFLNTAGSSTYHAAQVKVERRFAQGFSLLASYTFSKSITDAEAQQGWFNPGPQDNGNRQLEKSVSRFDVPHNLTLAYIYELPVGKGKLVNTSGVVDALVGGWQFSATHRYQSGYPLSVGAANTLGIFSGTYRPNRVTGVDPRAQTSSGGFDPATDVYLNRGGFAQPQPYTFGNSPRTLSDLRGFAFFNEDAALSKRFRFTEAVNTEVRVEAFNVLNRVVFNDPNTNFSDLVGFGRINGQANRPRVLQFGLRLRF